MLFSATMPAAIVALARTHMRHPMNIRAESAEDDQMVPATAQFIYQAHDLDKPEMIGRLLQAEGADLMIVFTRTKRQAQRIADDLEERGFNSAPLHGDMAQAAREKALTKFREGKLQVLVATDVAARGIDVTGVTHVVNYTCPEDEKTYLHRIGRTGRAGATGIAITFVDWADLHRWKMINKAHDLPFDDPQETYSSSEHFLHDQGIAPGTKGRIVPEGTIERKPRPESGGRGGRSEGGGRGGGRGGDDGRGGRNRGGRGSGGSSDSAGGEGRTQAGAGEKSGDRPAKKRNRSRSRTRGGKPAATGDAS
jgi:superfamily II DNA/RNA helicase